jgi:hypothetical protein
MPRTHRLPTSRLGRHTLPAFGLDRGQRLLLVSLLALPLLPEIGVMLGRGGVDPPNHIRARVDTAIRLLMALQN